MNLGISHVTSYESRHSMSTNFSHKHLFYSEMAKLLGAGFDIRKAAAVLLDTQLPAAQAVLLKDLEQGLNAGESIAAAFSRDSLAITQLERNLIRAGERGGKLAPAFQHLADYFGMLAMARQQAAQSLIYPVVVLHLGIIIGVVPAALIKGETGVTGIMVHLGMALALFYSGAFAIFVAARAVLKAAPENPKVDRLINRLPWVGQTRRNLAMARFCQVYHSCVLAGVSMQEAVQMASAASRSGVIREAGAGLNQAAKAGNPLGPQFLADEAFPKAFARSYATGEEAGTLDHDLARWAKRFQDEAASSVKNLAVVMPKTLYFLILGYAAWKVVAFYNGYYSDIFEQINK